MHIIVQKLKQMLKVIYKSVLKKELKITVWLFLMFLSHTAFSQRAFTLRTPAFNVRGDVALIGNRSLVGSSAANDDNATTMNNLDLDGDATTVKNSTSADLTLPAGSSVLWAGLYWAGRSTAATRNTIKFKKAGDTYTVYTATQLDDGNTISGITAENHFQSFIEMTTYVQAKGAGTYWGGDVITTIGNGASDPYSTGYYGGWALIVIYSDDTQPYRNITVFDGYSSVWMGNGTGTVTVPISGFLTPSSGTFTTKMGIIAWEGDKNITNDKLRLNANVDANNVSDANNPATNFFNGTITNSPRNPSTTQNWGVDFDYITSNVSLPLNATSTNVYFNTSGDFYMPGALVFNVDINPAVLPVNLVSFDAIRKANAVMVEWATASEENNDYFQVERSANGIDFETAGRLEGKGRSTSYQFYEFEDETAFDFANRTNPSNHKIYYRLRQVDYNGKFTFSDVRSVLFETEEALSFSVYPNPARGNAKINFSTAADSTIEIKITDSNGKTVFLKQLSYKDFKDFDLNHLKSGVYYIEAKDQLALIRRRFVVE
jgi:hypothetical protein